MIFLEWVLLCLRTVEVKMRRYHTQEIHTTVWHVMTFSMWDIYSMWDSQQLSQLLEWYLMRLRYMHSVSWLVSCIYNLITSCCNNKWWVYMFSALYSLLVIMVPFNHLEKVKWSTICCAVLWHYATTHIKVLVTEYMFLVSLIIPVFQEWQHKSRF